MKLSAPILSLFSVGLVAKADLMFDAKEDTVCTGVDFAQCSSGEKNFFAEQVEATFNKIYMPSRYLANTKWIGVDEGNGRRLQSSSGSHTGGESGCTFCPDDDAFVKDKKEELEGRVTWGRDLTTALAESGFPCFQTIKNCNVNLMESPRGMSVAENTKESSSPFEAIMRVQCKNVDWASLTSAEKNFAAAKLQRAFNSLTDGKKMLQDTQWESRDLQVASLMDYLVGFSWNHQVPFGFFRSGLLGNSAMEMKNLRANSDAELIDRWADMFEALLANGPFSSLSQASQCQIQIEALPNLPTNA